MDIKQLNICVVKAKTTRFGMSISRAYKMKKQNKTKQKRKAQNFVVQEG